MNPSPLPSPKKANLKFLQCENTTTQSKWVLQALLAGTTYIKCLKYVMP